MEKHETFRLFRCPLCGIEHSANSKSRRAPGTDGVVCKTCMPLHREQRNAICKQQRRRKLLERLKAYEPKPRPQLLAGSKALPRSYWAGAAFLREAALEEHRARLGIG